MNWLQSTFANRFNRLRKANGYVFQGSYNALLLDGGAVGRSLYRDYLRHLCMDDSEQRLPGLMKCAVDSRKGAEWKVATARWLRERYFAPHRWIAEQMNMGGPSSVQSLVSRHRRESKNKNASRGLFESYAIVDL